MTIRAKLIWVYVTTLFLFFGMGLSYYLAIDHWEAAAGQLSAIYAQDTRAEQLRSAILRQTGHALDFLAGSADAETEVRRLAGPAADRLTELKSHAKSVEESDHIEGLEETHTELMWVLERIFRSAAAGKDRFEATSARIRLREIADEVMDDVAALNQFYQAQIDGHLRHATQAGRRAELVAGLGVALAMLQVAFMIVAIRRWLVRPIARVTQATQNIATGDFATRVEADGRDEWSRLAQSINRMAASLSALERRLKSSERLATLGEAAAYTAHNIKNPLAGIRMAAQVSLAEMPANDRATAESLNDIIASVDRLDGWVKRFLDYARPLELCPAEVDLNALVREVAAFVGAHGKASGIALKLELDPALPRVTADRALMEQAIALILGNAYESGGDRVTVTTRREAPADEATGLAVEIADNGRGVAPEVRARLFQAFVSDKPGGTGLGLAQTKTVVELHGGEVRLESAVGRGTTVTIVLPQNVSAPRLPKPGETQ
jgi:signal transduction histidine kinase